MRNRIRARVVRYRKSHEKACYAPLVFVRILPSFDFVRVKGFVVINLHFLRQKARSQNTNNTGRKRELQAALLPTSAPYPLLSSQPHQSAVVLTCSHEPNQFKLAHYSGGIPERISTSYRLPHPNAQRRHVLPGPRPPRS